jgi:hypothetical protein
VLTSAAMANDPKNRAMIAKTIAPAHYLNQPEIVLNQVLTGRFADGLGKIQNVPDRAGFDPLPWEGMAIWMLTQMKRWGCIKGDVNYKQIADKVFLLADAKKHMKAMGQKVAEGPSPKFRIMGKVFDPARAAEYVKMNGRTGIAVLFKSTQVRKQVSDLLFVAHSPKAHRGARNEIARVVEEGGEVFFGPDNSGLFHRRRILEILGRPGTPAHNSIKLGRKIAPGGRPYRVAPGALRFKCCLAGYNICCKNTG